MNAQDAVKQVGDTLKGALKEVTTRIGGGATAPPVRQRLTVNQQLAAFARMSEADHQKLETEKGKLEYDRYVSAMLKLTGRG